MPTLRDKKNCRLETDPMKSAEKREMEMKRTHHQVHQELSAKQEGNKRHKISKGTRGSPEAALPSRLFGSVIITCFFKYLRQRKEHFHSVAVL